MSERKDKKAAKTPPAKAISRPASKAGPKAGPKTGSKTGPKTAAKSAAKKPGAGSRPVPGPGDLRKPHAAGAAAVAPPRPSRLDASRIEGELARALEQIEMLVEDRDNQVALAEAADTEREILQEQLAEALAKIRTLETRIEAAPAASSVAPEPSHEEDLPFEEEEEATPPEELDDVETLYSRMDDPRVRRGELDRERIERESEMSDESWWMVCPKCGDSLDEVEGEDVKLERCESCGGIYLDRGEIEMLLILAQGRHGLQRVRNVLSI